MAQNVLIFTLLSAVFLRSSLTAAYKYGAPESECDNMRPGHTGTKVNPTGPLISPTNGAPYYSIKVNKTTGIERGEYIHVQILADNCYVEGMTECYYEGFLIQARDPLFSTEVSDELSDSTKKYGMFMVTDNRSKLLCAYKSLGVYNQAYNGWVHHVMTYKPKDSGAILVTAKGGQGMTHAVHEHMDDVSFIWQAPTNMDVKDIQFRATVVKGYDTFFKNVRSEMLNNSFGDCGVPSIALVLIVSLLNLLNLSL